jgi:hypothetical protein
VLPKTGHARSRWPVFITIGLLLAVRSARAGFYQQETLPVGEGAALMAGAATAWVDDGSSSWYNPAGLGNVRSQGISATVNAYGAQRNVFPGYVDFGMYGRGDLRSTTTAIFPSYVGYVLPFGKSETFRQALGIAVVVPDYEHFQGVLNVPGATFAVNAHERAQAISQTLWALPGWGACWNAGHFCLGGALAFAYRTNDATFIQDFGFKSADGSYASGRVNQTSTWSASFGGTLGLQWQIAPALRVGASIRSPMRSVLAGGSLLRIDSNVETATRSSVARVEDQHLTIRYRLPAQARSGVRIVGNNWSLAGDVIFSMRQERFAYIRGANGEVVLQAVDAEGLTTGDPMVIGVDRQRSSILDFAAGGAYRVSTWSVMAGVFSNLSGAGTADDIVGSRLGVTLGVSRKGARSTRHAGLTFQAGTAHTTGVGQAGQDVPVSGSSLALYANIGVTADF